MNQDIQTIINKSEHVKKAKAEEGEKTPKEKKELSDEEKEYKSMRKQIQEKLIKFATRVPVFMYLTDYRERSLKDVITQLEPGLFKKVTGLDVKDFELFCSLGVFNANLMNDAIFKFKRYEDSSLSYTGIDKHEGKDIDGWDTVIKREEYEKLFYNQQATMAVEKAEENTTDYGKIIEMKSPKSYAVNIPDRKVAEKPTAHTYGTVAPKKPEPIEEIDIPEITNGTIVIHKKFGEGVATIDKAQKHITVKFSSGEKMFMYPDAFKNGYLIVKE